MCAELPDQPDVREPFQPSQRLWIAVFWFKDYASLQFFYQAALTGDTELGLEIRMNLSNYLHPFSLLFRYVVECQMVALNIHLYGDTGLQRSAQHSLA